MLDKIITGHNMLIVAFVENFILAIIVCWQIAKEHHRKKVSSSK